jgi:hypothetical protein
MQPTPALNRRRAGRKIHRHRFEFALDDRVFHQKFGYGNVVKIEATS